MNWRERRPRVWLHECDGAAAGLRWRGGRAGKMTILGELL
jgi:hypothetical protein